jgi:hypothetical protein
MVFIQEVLSKKTQFFLLLNNRLTTSQKRLIEVTLTAKPYPLTSPCFGVAKTSLSLRKERDVAQRQGEVTFSPFAFFELFSM